MNTMNIIDLHCDTLIKLHEQGCGLENVQGHIDLDALRRGGALSRFRDSSFAKVETSKQRRGPI